MFQPIYQLTNKILSELTAVAEAKVVIEKAKIIPTQELKLRRSALIRMTQSSTAIEGNVLNTLQVAALLQGKKIDAPLRDIYEVQNYLKTIKYIEEIIKTKKPITEKVILRIHHLVTNKTLAKEKCGRYRKSTVYIVKRQFGRVEKIVYTGPSAKKVPILMQELVHWIGESEKENIHPIIVAGIVHREIAAIHPFADGNGRVARALATMILYQRRFDFRKLFALEDYYNKDRQKYYQSIGIGPTYHKADFTGWLEYFIEGFSIEIKQVKDKILSLALAKVNRKLGKQLFLNKKQIQIVDYLGTFGKITIKEVIDILKCPKRTAQLELQKLKKLKLIKQKGRGPSTYYVL